MSIEVRQITKRFEQFIALNNISVKIPSGQLTALLGPSGCGKTTLLRIIAGMEQPDAGKVLFFGQDITQAHTRERRVGFVFQHYALFRHMTVFENIAFGLKIKPKKQRPKPEFIRKKVMELLELVQLGWLANSYPSRLSGGQRQRIALARALAVEPSILLLDEPFGALDTKVRKDLRRWLRHLHEEMSITSVFVTHDQEEALEVSDQVILLNQGSIEQIGTPDAVYSSPNSAFVYQFIGNVNIFEAKDYPQWLALATRASTACQAQIFIRPHEFDIHTEPVTDAIPTQVKHIQCIGPLVKIELLHNTRIIEVELPRNQQTQQPLQKHQHVWLRPQCCHLFQA